MSKILRYMGKRRLGKRREHAIANFYRSRNPEFPTWSGGKVYSGCIGTLRKKSSGKDQYDDMGRDGTQRTYVLADLVFSETKLDLLAT